MDNIMNEQITLNDTLQEFDAGIFVNKVHEALKKVALGVVNHNKKGTVTIQIDLERIGETEQVQIIHTVKYSQPTKRGKITEDNATSTPMHINRFGDLTISAQRQNDLFSNTTASLIREVK